MTLLQEKLATLPPELQLEVELFIEFLLEKHRRSVAAPAEEVSYWQAVSEPALDAIWANPEDDVYAELLTD